MRSSSKLKSNIVKTKRGLRVRRKIKAYGGFKHRLCVTRSLKHLSAQLIDDKTGTTLVAISTMSKESGGLLKSKEGAAFVGKRIAELANAKGVKEVVFDRGRNQYHGLVALIAGAARENGLKF